jgi:hypothetical protein
MAASQATASRPIVSCILQHLFDAEFTKIRVQSPGLPAEILECGPSLLSPILVNRLWADVGSTVLWRRHPPVEAFAMLPQDRRQWYADKVEDFSVIDSAPGASDDPAHLQDLHWPNLKSVEAYIDWAFLSTTMANMLHPGLLRLELSGPQLTGSIHIAEVVLPALLAPCTNLEQLHIRPDTIDPEEPINAQVLEDLLDCMPSVKDVRVRMANFFGKDLFFARLSQRPGLEVLKIDLDQGLQLLPLFSGPEALPSAFTSLRRLHIMCDPEIALALPAHLDRIEELQMDIERVPDTHIRESDLTIFDDLLATLSACPDLLYLKVNVGNLAIGFPSAILNLPLNGSALLKLSTSCPKLRLLDLAALEPSTIDGSGVSSLHFDAFCAGLPHLTDLRLRLHPSTATILQTTALPSLAKHCPHLEAVRVGIPLLLPLLLESTPDPAPVAEPNLTTVTVEKRDISTLRVVETSTETHISPPSPLPAMTPPPQIRPLFPHVTHLAFARPETSFSHPFIPEVPVTPTLSPAIEEAIVDDWATALAINFPRLEMLEAWGDWSGKDKDILAYLLPLEEVLATTWEFLSGAEQDLWEHGDDSDELEILEGEEAGGFSDFDVSPGQNEDGLFSGLASPNDWEKASFMNEFPEGGDADSGYQEYYDDEVR